jgi:hypothetical protein
MIKLNKLWGGVRQLHINKKLREYFKKAILIGIGPVGILFKIE